MKVRCTILKKLSEKYYLDYDKFKFVTYKKFLSKKFFILYGANNYFFEIDKNYNQLKNFFPYFANDQLIDNLEIWINSISQTQKKHFKIIKSLNEGKRERETFKKKFDV